MSCHAAKGPTVKPTNELSEVATAAVSANSELSGAGGGDTDATSNAQSTQAPVVGDPSADRHGVASTDEKGLDGEPGCVEPPSTRAQVISKDEPLAVKKRRVIELKTAELLGNKDRYYDNLSEVYFLKDGGQLMDLLGWRRKPPAAFLEYMRARLLDPIEDEPQRILNLKAANDGGRTTGISTPVATPPTTPVISRESGRELRDHQHHHSTHNHGRTSNLHDGGGRTSPPISVCSGDELAERAKHEAHVLQRVAALRKVGLWAQQRLPKVQEPPRAKAHWDYLLEEMKWMSNDFAQERKLKKAIARKCARMCQKYHQEKELRAQRAERDEQLRIRKLAATIAKDVKTFWANAEKLLEFRIHTKVAAKRKEALDLQLNLLVDRTEKFSDQIRDKLAVDTPSGTAAPSVADTMSDVQDRDNDGDFVDESSEEDDEETIAKQEQREKIDHKQELDELEGDNALSVEELLAKYYSREDGGGDVGDRSLTPSEASIDDEDAEDDAEEEDDDDEDENESGQGDLPQEEPMEEGEQQQQQQQQLPSSGEEKAAESNVQIKDEKQESAEAKDQNEAEMLEEDEDKLGGLTAVAEKFQPKGLDLATAQVKTPVPFLLKHTLREYQHVGLDWLVAMCDQKLNGILADEMGLGKTIQTISLLAHLAVEKGLWGPHLVIVPTSVMLNWEMEFKKWCPGFKILTYYGSVKERKQKRVGWTKKNTFHVCITSYKLVIQDHAAFRRKHWYYLILDEAQNIKNFKSQRWQLLVNFQAERRLLLTGTPLQNTLMELWSLMHFLMPHLFESHKEFREWFSNPLTGMVEGSSEYNEALVKRLHRVLRPFLLRRLKSEVEKQMPQKYEHVMMCRLSKRQRFLYDDFMSQGKTRETLASGKLLSVLNVLMQLRKVCNHPALFEPRPVSSPFRMDGLVYRVPSLLLHMESPLKTLFASLNLHLADLELVLTAFAAHRIKKFQTTPQYIEGAESHPPTPPRCPSGKIRLHIRTTTTPATAQVPRPPVLAQVGTAAGRVVSGQLRAASTSQTGRIVMLGQRPDSASGQTTHAQPVTFQLLQKAQAGQAGQLGGQQPPVTLHVQQTGASRATTGALHRIVQTTSGQHILLTTAAPQPATGGGGGTGTIRPGGIVRMPVSSSGQTTTASALQGHPAVASQRPQSLLSPHKPVVTTVGSSVGVIPQTVASRPPTPVTAGTPPRNITTTSHAIVAGQKTTTTNQITLAGPTSVATSMAAQRKALAATVTSTTVPSSAAGPEKSPFFIDALEKRRRAAYQAKLKLLGRINNMRCAPGPVYGQDLIEAVSVMTLEDRVPPPPPKRVAPLQTPYPEEIPENAVRRAPYGTGVGHLYTQNIHAHTSWWSDTNALRELVPSPEILWERYEAEWNQFLCIHPRVSAPPIEMHASHPPPYLVNSWKQTEGRLRQELQPKINLLARIALRQQTQFPDRRLIQFDCGKLQTLDQLLVQLKSGGHRVLIFTQMARMLDVLEEFLTMHGHTYLRLDGATGIEQRQVLVERFNSDQRLFCFILSTRSGGVGLNLTGADTVVFYDSDWNPTMDAQAQDRCHRIGQTRDVHIYRLVSERTIEENILRKANQKRMLGELAIEGGNFTTSFFRSNTITDLFEDQSSEKLKVKNEVVEEEEQPLTTADLRREQEDFERTLIQVEEEADARAAKRARAEASADLAEFDEEIAYQEGRGLGTEETEEERVLMSQLNSVEKYALRFLETQHDFEDLKQAEEQVEAQKREWMLNRLQSQKEREEALKETSPLVSYKRPHSPQEVKSNGKPATATLTQSKSNTHKNNNRNNSNNNTSNNNNNSRHHNSRRQSNQNNSNSSKTADASAPTRRRPELRRAASDKSSATNLPAAAAASRRTRECVNYNPDDDDDDDDADSVSSEEIITVGGGTRTRRGSGTPNNHCTPTTTIERKRSSGTLTEGRKRTRQGTPGQNGGQRNGATRSTHVNS